MTEETPVREVLGGPDISWLVGLVVTAAVYYPWARRTTRPPDRMTYPSDALVGQLR